MKKYQLALILGLVLIGSLILAIWQPFKVIDPRHPRFNVEKFRFTDYDQNAEITYDYYRVLFPVGMPREEVEKILIDYGNGKLFGERVHPQISFYDEPGNYLSGHHTVIYDKNDKLLNMAFQLKYLYPENLTVQEILESGENL
jgi:hypothetical protein